MANGITVADLFRKHGVSDAAVCTWKAKYGGMDACEAKWRQYLLGKKR